MATNDSNFIIAFCKRTIS